MIVLAQLPEKLSSSKAVNERPFDTPVFKNQLDSAAG